ncbi:MAG: phage major capsid protein [Verrucomicrobia bacterium]|nr:phage major capsid protein [Verrucomicrobiota bacterium]
MKLTLALLLLVCAAKLPAAEEADPAMAVLKRMRDQLRNVMIQQQKTEAERATLQAANLELEEKVKKQEADFKKLAKDSNAQKDADAKAIAELKAKVMADEREKAQLQEALANWKSGYEKLKQTAMKVDAQRAELSARVILQDRKVADYQRKNDELFKVGSEILSKYEGFGLGTAIAAREPFTRNMRVKLETLVQDYGDKLVDSKIKPDEAPKSAAKPTPKDDPAKVQAPAKR